MIHWEDDRSYIIELGDAPIDPPDFSENECDDHPHRCAKCCRIIPCRRHPDAGVYCEEGES